MSLEGDTADKMVHEGLQVTETVVKLAGLGAKNLAALLLALLRDNVKLKGKTGMNRLLRTDKPLATFTIKKEDLAAFKKHATSHGILFSAVANVTNDKGLCDVVARAEDASRINQILENMGYDAPIKGAEKNGKARAQPGGKSNGRGFGFLQQAMERRANPVKQFEGKTGGLESLGAERLAAMILAIAGENVEFKEASPLSRLFANGQNIQFGEIAPGDAPALLKKAAALDIPMHFQQGDKPMMIARAEDAPVINRLCEMLGIKPIMPDTEKGKAPPQTQKRKPGRPPKSAAQKSEKTSVRDKVGDAKQQGKSGKATPAKAKESKPKAPKPKAPAR